MIRHILIYSLLLLALLCPAALKANNYVIINQVMYDTPLTEEAGTQGAYNGEFFEIYNGGKDAVDLSYWSVHSLSGTKHREVYWFPDLTIPAGGCMIFASRQGNSNTFKMEELYSSITQDLGPKITYYTNNFVLSNKKETLLLIDAQADTVDQVVFGTETPLKAGNWMGRAGDDCISLHRTGLELDDRGKIIPSKNQWKSDKVSFGVCQLPNPTFGVNHIISSASLATGNNYIMTISPLDAVSEMSSTQDGISVDADIRTKTSIQYYDGLGRPNELVAVGVTPNKKDLVSTTVYNGLHRVTQKWLPVPMDTKGAYTDVKNVQNQAIRFFSDGRPYTESVYENSALNRVVQQKQPGDSYAANPSKYTYAINEETDRVRIYTVVNDSDLRVEGFYKAYTLYKTTIADEDGISVVTYTDKLGRKIMEERAGGDHFRTYFVYDDLGHLRFVLPHIDPSKLSSGTYSLSNSTLRAACYCYKYDDRGNMIYKRLPGCEPQLMVYDKMGQLILKQDGNQRDRYDSYIWTLYGYDSIGRNVYTAEAGLRPSRLHNTLRLYLRNRWLAVAYGEIENNYEIDRSGYAMSYISTLLSRIITDHGAPKYYIRPLSVNYYDTYDFLENEGEGLEYKDGYDAPYNNATGLLTGTRVYNLSEPGYTTTVYYYDAKGRVIQSRSRRSTDGQPTVKANSAVTSTRYNFDGTMAETKTIQEIGTDKVTERYRNTYDHIGRTKQVMYQLNFV